MKKSSVFNRVDISFSSFFNFFLALSTLHANTRKGGRVFGLDWRQWHYKAFGFQQFWEVSLSMHCFFPKTFLRFTFWPSRLRAIYRLLGRLNGMLACQWQSSDVAKKDPTIGLMNKVKVWWPKKKRVMIPSLSSIEQDRYFLFLKFLYCKQLKHLYQKT